MALDTDREGFLKHLADWNVSAANELAQNAGIELTSSHWEVIEIARGYYEQHGIFPANRVLISKMREAHSGKEVNSIYLMQLFTGKPRRFIAMISGLPKPTNCD